VPKLKHARLHPCLAPYYYYWGASIVATLSLWRISGWLIILLIIQLIRLTLSRWSAVIITRGWKVNLSFWKARTLSWPTPDGQAACRWERQVCRSIHFALCCKAGRLLCFSCIVLQMHQRVVMLQGGSNMTGTNCDLFTHDQSRSYLNHPVFRCTYFFRTASTVIFLSIRVEDETGNVRITTLSNKYYVLVCMCAHAKARACMCMRVRACSVAYPACNSYAP
jgi:hypothetical protein